MFVRSKSSVRNGASYEYLQIVRSYREGGKVRQQVIASLGRRDRLIASGELDGLLRSLAKFSDNLRVVEAVRTSGLAARTAQAMGAGPGLWAPVGPAGAPRPPGTTGPGPEVRVRPGTGCFRHGAAAVVRSRFRSRRLGMGQDGGRAWVRGPGPATLLPHRGVSGRGAAGPGNEALSPGPEPVQPDPGCRVHRHHQPVLLPGHGDGVAEAGLLPGPSTRPAPVGVVRSR